MKFIFDYLDGDEINLCPAVSVLIEVGAQVCEMTGDNSVADIWLIHGAN